MNMDYVLVMPIIVHIIAGVRFGQAYLLFPRGLKEAVAGVELGAFGEHIQGARCFILWCAVSHAVMTVVMSVMLAVMIYFPEWAYFPVAAIFWMATIPLLLGGEYSHYRARRLNVEAHAINEFLLTVNAKDPKNV